MFNDVVKPLIEKGKEEEIKIINLEKYIETTMKDFKLLNSCIRNPQVVGSIQRACKRLITKDGNKKIERKVVSKLKQAGFYDLEKEPIEKFAKKLNQYFSNAKE